MYVSENHQHVAQPKTVGRVHIYLTEDSDDADLNETSQSCEESSDCFCQWAILNRWLVPVSLTCLLCAERCGLALAERLSFMVLPCIVDVAILLGKMPQAFHSHLWPISSSIVGRPPELNAHHACKFPMHAGTIIDTNHWLSFSTQVDDKGCLKQASFC